MDITKNLNLAFYYNLPEIYDTDSAVGRCLNTQSTPRAPFKGIPLLYF